MPRRKLFFKIVVVFAVIFGCLLVAELGLRWQKALSIHRDPTWNAWTTVNRKSADPILVYDQTPGAISVFKGAPIAINSDGFRDDEFSGNVPEGTRRIVVLGDSVGWGWGVAMDKAFPQLLEEKLKAAKPPNAPPSIVYNLAIAGYSTKQEIQLLKTRGLALKPDLIIIAYVLNDPDTSDGGLSSYFTAPRIELLNRIKVAKYKMKHPPDTIELSKAANEDYAYFVHGFYQREIVESFRQLGEISRQNHVPILIAVNPVMSFGAGDPNPWDKPVQWLKTLATSNGLLFIDLYEAFKGVPSDDIALDWWHPNENGHAIVAGALYKYLASHAELKFAAVDTTATLSGE